MRPLTFGDLGAALAALLAVPEAERPTLAALIVAEADMADRWRKRLGRAHPRFGGGSILAAAQRHPQLTGAPVLCPAATAALATFLAAWHARRLPGL